MPQKLFFWMRPPSHGGSGSDQKITGTPSRLAAAGTTAPSAKLRKWTITASTRSFSNFSIEEFASSSVTMIPPLLDDFGVELRKHPDHLGAANLLFPR